MMGELTEQSFARALVGMLGKPILAIGPTLWILDDETDTVHWLFMIGLEDKDSGWMIHNITSESKDGVDLARDNLIRNIPLVSPAIAVHTFDTELEMAHLCATVWPCPATFSFEHSIEQHTQKPRTALN